MRLRILAMSAVTALMLSACNEVNCASVGRYSMIIRVQSASGDPVCDAEVTVTDGAFTAAAGPTGDCTYRGPGEREGTYSVEASKAGSSGRVEGVRVKRSGACHDLHTEQVTVKLSA
jgi:hypothetical protein